MKEMFVKQKDEVESSKLYRGETENETMFYGLSKFGTPASFIVEYFTNPSLPPAKSLH